MASDAADEAEIFASERAGRPAESSEGIDHEGGVVDREGVMPILCAACPSFAEVWDPSANLEDGERLLYLDIGEFVAHVLDLLAAGRSPPELDDAFDAVERLHLRGDSFVRELATVGVLEGFQSAAASRRGVDPEEQVRPWLRLQSLRWWERLNEFWGGDVTALRDDDGGDRPSE